MKPTRPLGYIINVPRSVGHRALNAPAAVTPAHALKVTTRIYGQKEVGIMHGEITGLEFTLQRISSIESNFNKLFVDKTDRAQEAEDFKKILESKLDNKIALNCPPDNEGRGIDDLVRKYAGDHGLDPDLIRAIIKQESDFNPKATSKCGAMGLMQLMPATAKGLGVVDAYDPEQNIKGGVKYLSDMLNRFNYDTKKALAAYNAGPGAVERYGAIPPYPETQNYVKVVLENYNNLKKDRS